MHGAGCICKFDREAQHIERAVLRMLDGDPHLLVLRLRVVKYLGQTQHAAAGYAGGVEPVDPVRNRTAAGALVDGLIDQRARLEAIRIGLQVRMLF